MSERRGDDRAIETAAEERSRAPSAAVALPEAIDDPIPWRSAHSLAYPHAMGEGPANENPEVERILDEMLDELSEFFDDDFREDVRDFMLDAAAEHPWERRLA